MKKTILLSLISVLAFFVSCSDDSDGPEIYENTFKGTLLYKGAELNSDAECGVNIIDNIATVTLYGVSFAPAMPAMDIVIEGLSCAKSDDGYVITGTDVLPSVAGRPVEAYAMSEVTARVSGDTFVLNCETARGAIGFDTSLSVVTLGNKSFRGNLVVGDFIKESTVSVGFDEANSVVTMVIKDAKFAENMPLTIDITLKDMPYVVGDAVTFSAIDIVPYMNAEPEPSVSYTFASVEGTMAGDALVFTAKMSESLAPYVAGKVFEFEGELVTE